MVSQVEGRAGSQARPRGGAARVVVRVATLVAAIGAMLLGAASAAFASTTAPDPTGGVFTQAQSQFSQYVIPGAVAIFLLVLVFGLATMYAKKTAKKS